MPDPLTPKIQAWLLPFRGYMPCGDGHTEVYMIYGRPGPKTQGRRKEELNGIGER
jgi:hypothetical protein